MALARNVRIYCILYRTESSIVFMVELVKNLEFGIIQRFIFGLLNGHPKVYISAQLSESDENGRLIWSRPTRVDNISTEDLKDA